MPIAVLVSLAVQILLAIHVARTGRPLFWIYIIVFIPIVGPLVYFVSQVVPDLRNDPHSRRVAAQVIKTFDPERQKRRIADRLGVADTIANRRALAEECLNLGDYADAAELYRSILKGLYATDPGFMLGLARAQAGLEDFAGCRQTLDELIRAHPDFRSDDGHLLYARSLEALGELEAACHEYATLATSYPGEESRLRYGRLLIRLERYAEARAVFEDMLKREKAAPRYYRKKEKAWLAEARAELGKLGPKN